MSEVTRYMPHDLKTVLFFLVSDIFVIHSIFGTVKSPVIRTKVNFYIKNGTTYLSHTSNDSKCNIDLLLSEPSQNNLEKRY